jgi:hypothetical protein
VRRDKALHLAFGGVVVLAASLIVAISNAFGPGPAAAAATTMVGVVYELQQLIRREGEPSWPDALTTAAPGWLFWLLLELRALA